MWRPMPKPGWARPYSAASRAAGQRVMKLVLVTMPCSWAWMMPRLTPGLMPKSSAFTTRRLMSDTRHPLLKAQVVQKPLEDGFGAEILLGDGPGGAAVPRVVGADGLEGG